MFSTEKKCYCLLICIKTFTQTIKQHQFPANQKASSVPCKNGKSREVGGPTVSEIPSMVGVWIFSGTTHLNCILCFVNLTYSKKTCNFKCNHADLNVQSSLFLFDAEGSVIQALTNITVIEGENSNLTCHVSGTPMPSVSWTEVRTSNRTEGNIRSLINVSRSDAGEYKCEASNFCGNDSKSTFLIVNCK